jgi:Flp pilus assembly protein TadD
MAPPSGSNALVHWNVYWLGGKVSSGDAVMPRTAYENTRVGSADWLPGGQPTGRFATWCPETSSANAVRFDVPIMSANGGGSYILRRFQPGPEGALDNQVAVIEYSATNKFNLMFNYSDIGSDVPAQGYEHNEPVEEWVGLNTGIPYMVRQAGREPGGTTVVQTFSLSYVASDQAQEDDSQRSLLRDETTNLLDALAKSDWPRLDDKAKEASTYEPENPDFHNWRGIALANENKGNDAIGEYQKALALATQNPTFMSNLGLEFIQLGRYPDADTWLKKGLSLSPKDPNINNAIGNLLFQQGKFSDCVSYYQTAIGALPTWATPYANLAGTYLRLNQLESARLDAASAFARGEKKHWAVQMLLAIVGRWSWVENQTLEFKPDGTCSSTDGNTGSWGPNDMSKREFLVAWHVSDGRTIVDHLTVSPDGRLLSGTNSYGNAVSGSRLGDQ